jgi:hypothetical protein
MSPQGVMTRTEASYSPGLSPIKGKKFSSGTQTVSRDEFSSLSLSITKTTSLSPMLVDQPATEPLFVHISLLFISRVDKTSTSAQVFA